jgi:hypothetical protein
MNKWSKDYWIDLTERAGSTAVYGVITMLTADQSGAISGSAEQWWLVVGLPTALSLLKGLAANLKDPESGASLVNHPPGPEVV